MNQSEQYGIDIPCGDTFLGNGITFFDYDNDGWDDLTIASSIGYPVHFLKNIGGFFVTQNINIELPDIHQSRQINWVDIDNDGDNDLFITSDNFGNSLYENLGNMVMLDISSTCGMLTDILPYYGASWGDYNNDGYLDVFVSVRDSNTPNILYRNNGDKTFSIVNNEAGIIPIGKLTFCSAFFDYDNDGDQDIYVANDKSIYTNDLYMNNGDGTFTEVGAFSGTDIAIDAMSVTIDDYNYDGWLDIYVTNEVEGNILLSNNQDGTFLNVANISQTEVFSDCWGAVFFDADNNTDLDLYVSCEHNGTNSNFLSSAFFENDGDDTFTINNNAVPEDFAKSFSNAIGDINNNGYSDIVVNHINHNNIYLWKNETPQSNNWLKVKLEGTISNRNGIGSFIEISINGEKQYRYTLCGEGYLSQNSATEIFGLGPSLTIDYIKVSWLSGIEDIIYDVNANQTLTIVEGSALSINENGLNQLTHYPNPVKNTLSLNASTNNIEDVAMFNMLGQQVMQLRPNALTSDVDMSGLQTGTYFVKVIVAGVTKTIRIVKQ